MTPAGLIALRRNLDVATRESRVVGAVRRLAGRLGVGTLWVAGGATADPSEFDGLYRMLSSSIATRAAGTWVAAASNAWRASSLNAISRRVRQAWGLLREGDRMRLIGCGMTAATATDGILSLLDPRPASGYRWLLWAAALLCGLALTAWPKSVAAAFEDRRRGLS